MVNSLLILTDFIKRRVGAVKTLLKAVFILFFFRNVFLYQSLYVGFNDSFFSSGELLFSRSF